MDDSRRILWVSFVVSDDICSQAKSFTVSEIVLFASLGLVPSYAVAQGFGSGTGTYLLVVLNAYVHLQQLALLDANILYQRIGYGTIALRLSIRSFRCI